ncbi:spindle assembly checkpoint component Mad1 [Amanita rubescens]|nr:spindle assembly checkpoint component Mad1 [Amanita rubescens]
MSSSRVPKRDSLAAELERDPQLSSAKRQQRQQLFTSTIAHASLERQLATSQSNKMELEAKLREKTALVERLERDRRWLADREKEQQEERERERAEHAEEKRNFDATVRDLRTRLTSLQEEHADLSDAHTTMSQSTSGSVASLKLQIASLNAEQVALQAALMESQALTSQQEATIESLRSQLLSQSQGESRKSLNEDEAHDMAVIRDELHRQASYLRSLEKDNAKLTREVTMLRENSANVEVMREEKRGLERKLRTMDEMRNKVVALEAEVEAARKEREAWASSHPPEPESLSSSTSGAPPVAHTQQITTLRLEHAALLESHGSTAALLRSRDAELAAARGQSEKLCKNIVSLEEHIRALEQKMRRRETRLGTAEREIGFLQALVASYTAEASHAGATGNEESSRAYEAQVTRVNQLETLLAQYKSANQALSQEVDAMGDETTVTNADDPDSLVKKAAWNKEMRVTLQKEVERAREEKTNLQQKILSLEGTMTDQADRIDKLEQELFELTGEIAGGRHVPPGVRVLCMRENPEQQWFDLRQEAMNRLRGENEALLRRLGVLEEKAKQAGVQGQTNDEQAAGPDLVPKESFELAMKEKLELQDVVKQKEKRLLRLQQVFTSKSTEFREAIASILGVKLAFYPNGQVRVTSTYDLGASFVFQPIKTSGQEATVGMRMQLVAQGEGGPQDLPNMMHYWIEKEQCIPGFMASITLESWEKHKSGGGT